MYQRPKKEETDEDLLKLQEEFFKNKSKKDFKLAATVISSKEATINEAKEVTPTNEASVQEHLDNTFEDIPKHNKIGSIVEKRLSNAPISCKFSNTGFPQAQRRKIGKASGKGSLFSQQMKKIKQNEEDLMDIDENMSIEPEINPSGSQTHSFESDLVKKEIHQENLETLNKMSKEEIQEEKERLIATLDPAIVAFLKSRHQKNKPKEQTRQPTISQQNKEAVKVEEIESVQEILNESSSNKWINFDSLETTKLAWMKNIDIPKLDEKQQYEARFDFAGWLMPFTQSEINEKTRVLYHHGEETGRPGYTLRELFQLSRSNVIQQKTIALNAIANILSVSTTGVYEDVIDIPIEQIFFVIRFCLDDNTPATVNASIKCLRNLFYNKIDETCLDCLLNFGITNVQPMLAIDVDQDDNTINDQQLAESNLVKCLLRSGILVRIRYIFNTVRPNELETIVYCLEILIRLARDSEFIANEVFSFDGLIESVIKNFLPPVLGQINFNSTYNTPVSQALKFLRLLACRNPKYAEILLKKYKIIDPLFTYIENDFVSLNSTGLKLQIETFRFWRTILDYKLGVDYFNQFTPLLLRVLDYHLRNTNVNSSWTLQEHAATFFNLLSSVAKIKTGKETLLSETFLRPIFEIGIVKFTNQFQQLQEYSCGKLQLISSFINLFINIFENNILDPSHEEVFCKLLNKLMTSTIFHKMMDNIPSASNLLNNYKVYKSSANLKCVEAAVWNASEHIVPILQSNSCLPFLTSLSSFVKKNKELSNTFLRSMEKYLKLLAFSKNHYLTSNWFTKVESTLILNILEMCITLQNDNSLLDAAFYFELASKTLCIFTAEHKLKLQSIFKNIIFNSKFYPAEVFLGILNIKDETRDDSPDNMLKISSELLEGIHKVYTNVLGLNKDLKNMSQTQLLDISLGNIVPLDWIYSPIIALYSNQNKSDARISETEQNFVITICLHWVYVYETFFPTLAALINPTDKFCRLICTFLGSDTLFLLPEIQKLLAACLKLILDQDEQNLDFDKSIHGLQSFQDLYTQVLEQYQGVSYGDKLFGNFILVPLAQRHNVKFRKALWSEYAAIVQIFNVTPEEVFGSIEQYLYPLESDESLIHCYRNVIVSGSVRKFSVLYKIAKHHCDRFLQSKSEKVK